MLQLMMMVMVMMMMMMMMMMKCTYDCFRADCHVDWFCKDCK